MALSTDLFNEGDAGSGSDMLTVELDMASSGAVGTTYEVLCFTSASEEFSDNVVTNTDSCSDGITTGVVASQEYKVSYEAILKKGTVSDTLYQAALNKKIRQNIPVRVSNSLADLVKTFPGYVGIDTVDYPTDDIVKISGSIGVYSGGAITESTFSEATPEIPTTGGTVAAAMAEAKKIADTAGTKKEDK